MTRLQSEFRRLYLPTAAPSAAQTAESQGSALIGADGRVRALVIELTDPADWEPLAPLWRGVQTELDLPAPAIAVSGSHGLQLWFSLVEAVDVATAQAFLEALRRRYLGALPERRLRLLPSATPSNRQDLPTGAIDHAAPLPALQPTTGLWSAFVAPDLAPLFSDTPWLDVPPGDEGQANLLAALVSIRPAQFDAALARLQPAESAPRPAPVTAPVPAVTPHPAAAAQPFDRVGPGSGPTTPFHDPREFLRAVMNDPGVTLALRIEAARALLPASG